MHARGFCRKDYMAHQGGVPMIAKHSPGPWHTWQVGLLSSVFVNNEHGSVCLVTMNEHDEANARLIAAAPELLYALKRAFAVISQHHPEDKDCCAHDIKTIPAAIRKAEGTK
jgi:hypothetical protein